MQSCCVFFLLHQCSHLHPSPQTQLGITKVNITVLEAAGASAASLHFINVHQNENTSVVAAKALMYFVGGYLLINLNIYLYMFLYICGVSFSVLVSLPAREHVATKQRPHQLICSYIVVSNDCIHTYLHTYLHTAQ